MNAPNVCSRTLVIAALLSASALFAPPPASAQAGAQPAAQPAAPPATDGGDKRVTVNLRSIPMRAALELLFQGTGFQYAVDPNVLDVPVTLNIRDQPFRIALRTLLRLAAASQPGLTHTEDNGIYVIKIRAPIAPPVEEAPVPVDEAETIEEYHWEKVPVNYINVLQFAMAPGFGIPVFPSEDQVTMMMGGGMMGGMGMMGGGMGMMGGGMGGMMGGMGGMMGGMGGMMGGMGGMGMGGMGMGGMGMGGMMGGMGGMGMGGMGMGGMGMGGMGGMGMGGMGMGGMGMGGFGGF